jgi:hypothetical protein
VDFLKYDTTLGREQNIDIGKPTSLANFENLNIKRGVKLSQFMPEKYIGGGAQASGYINISEDNS